MTTVNSRYGWVFPEADAFMASQIKPDGGYQSSHLTMALTHVTDWSVACDGGAHVGTWSRLLNDRFARVIAVEPSQDTFLALQLNMRQFDCTNVELLNVALGATEGRVSMVLDGRGAELANTGARYVQAGGSIPSVTIDSWRLPSLGFLKLDVEGSEVAAMQGAKETLIRCRPVVLFENKFFWRRFGFERNAPQDFLKSLGYQHVATASCDQIWSAVQ